MRMGIRGGFFSLVVAGFFCVAGSCSANTEINEPVFGSSYFSSQASFQKIPLDDLGTACLEMARASFAVGDKASPWLYLYGDYRNGDTRLTIVGDRDGTAIFVRRGQACADGSVVVTLLQLGINLPGPNGPPYLSQHEIQGVFADLLQRYVAAFGSKAKFFAWLDRTTKLGLDSCKGMSQAYCPPTWHDLPPDLQTMLEEFRQNGS